jgi:hypothetical protein
MDEKEEGKIKDEGSREETPSAGAPGGGEKPGKPGGGEKPGGKGGAGELPPVNFSSFVFSLSTSALLNLGEIKDPSAEKVEKDTAMAKHTIDIIAMLKDKSKGNLDENEARLIENVLHDLRMRYLRAVEEDSKKGE